VCSPREVFLTDHAEVDDHLGERDRPRFVIGARRIGVDGGDEALPKLVPVEPAQLYDGERHAEDPPLPRRVEDELTVLARECSRTRHLLHLGSHERTHSRATPIIPSRVTVAASSASVAPPVPAGRSGTTR
jgi:hypothetical protein